MKYRLETQQVFGMMGQGLDYDANAEWCEHNEKPRGLTAAKAAMQARFDNSGFKPPIRVVSVDALGDRVEVARIESPHKPAPKYAVEVTDAQGEKRQEFESLPLAMQMYSACVDGAENDPRKGYTRRVALVGIESGDTYYQWDYKKEGDGFKRESVHIDTIRVGDTVEIEGVLKTVCRADLKPNTFMGTTLFGDSHRLGTVPVIKATPIHVTPLVAAQVEPQAAKASKPIKYHVVDKATGESVSKTYHNYNGALYYCDQMNNESPGAYEVRNAE